MSDPERVSGSPVPERRHEYDGGRGVPALRSFDLREVPPSVEGRFALELAATPDTHNLHQAVHGGVIAMLIDHTGGLAAGVLTDRAGPTADLHVRYLNPGRTPTLRAEARVLRAGRRLVIMAVEVTDEDGQLVAAGDLTVAVGTRRPGSEFPD